MKKEKYTIEELRELATRSYPSALKEVLSNKYKVDGFNGYLLLDNLNNDGTVPQLFYDGKWRQDNINIIKDNILYTLINSDGLTFGRFGTIEEAMKNIKELKDNTRLKGYNIVANWETAEAVQLSITKDNIHLYYEFLSPDALSSLKENTKAGLSSILQERINILSSNLNIDDKSFGEHFKVASEGRWINKSFIFGVKDTLEPIDEYITEIKQSPAYINYQLKELLKQKNREYIKVCDIDQDIYPFCTMNVVNIGKYNHDTAAAVDGKHLLVQGVLYHDNISTYYEFMSDEDIENNINIISSILYSRHIKVDKELFLSTVNLDEKNKYVFVSRLKSVFSSVVSFGIKDTLKPIDEYIADIKQSSTYQEYNQDKSLEGLIHSISIDENMDVEKEKASLDQRVNQDTISQDYN